MFVNINQAEDFEIFSAEYDEFRALLADAPEPIVCVECGEYGCDDMECMTEFREGVF